MKQERTGADIIRKRTPPRKIALQEGFGAFGSGSTQVISRADVRSASEAPLRAGGLHRRRSPRYHASSMIQATGEALLMTAPV
jgi:hypothetical protein